MFLWCKRYQNFSWQLRYLGIMVNDWVITMTNLNRSFTLPHEQELNFWENLKAAISASSGFKRWQEEQVINEPIKEDNLDERVSNYLRETLEALAY